MFEKKVNVGLVSGSWLMLMFIPFANGFLLRGRAKQIFNKLFALLGLLCSIVPIASYILAILVPIVTMNFMEQAYKPIAVVSVILTLAVPLVSYIACIIIGFMMKDEYAYKKAVLDYADKHKVVYNDFETAENEVIAIVKKEKEVTNL